MSQKQTFDEWLEQVDRLLVAKTGMDHDDLPDYCYRRMYDDRTPVGVAARRAIKNAKES
jgi:hypothetical protein